MIERIDTLALRVAARFAYLSKEARVNVTTEIKDKVSKLEQFRGVTKVVQKSHNYRSRTPVVLEIKFEIYTTENADFRDLLREINHIFRDSAALFPKRSRRGVDPIRLTWVYREPHAFDFAASEA